MTFKEIIELILIAPLLVGMYFIAWRAWRNLDL